MEDENYRNFVVSRLNTSLDKKLTDDDEYLEDMVSRPWVLPWRTNGIPMMSIKKLKSLLMIRDKFHDVYR